MTELQHTVTEMLFGTALISSWCLGLYKAADTGMVLEKPVLWLQWLAGRKRLRQLREVQKALSDDTKWTIELEYLANRLETGLSFPELLLKPLITCIACMASLHGLLLLIIFWDRLTTPGTWLVSIVFSCFLNSFIWRLYERLKN